jgi:RNA polymerase sigma-70 factor (ECF subfamily)
MIGSVMDAEDLVQETYVRWMQADPPGADQRTTGEGEAVRSPKAYLSSIVTRLCIDHLRSARVRREQYVGPWLPEPLIVDSFGPAEKVELGDTLSLAFLVLLEQLNPLERAVFLLREVFDYDYAEISQIVEKSEVNCRQIVRRARSRLADRRPRFNASTERGRELAAQFMSTCARGEVDRLVEMLSDDIVAWSDGGGKVYAARKPVRGRDLVARFMIGLFERAPSDLRLEPAPVNGQPGYVVYIGDRLHGVVALELADERVRRIFIVVNPDKLAGVSRQVGFG